MDIGNAVQGSIPAAARVGLIGVVIGSLTAVFGNWLNNKSSDRRLKLQLDSETLKNKQRLRQQRLEDLYVLIDRWSTGLGNKYLSLSMVMPGKLTYTQFFDLSVESLKEFPIDYSRLEMLVQFYAPE